MIEGRQVVLRDLRREDLPLLREGLQPGREWQRLDGPYYPRGDAQAVEKQLESLAARVDSGDWPEPRTNLVIAEAGTDRLLGRVSRYWQSQETHWLSVGVVLFEPGRWRRGLGHEALGLWCQYLLDEMPELARLDLRTWSGNVGMMRLAEKLGFRQEARFRKARVVDGEHFDGLGYGVLREEWDAKYPGGFARSLPG